MNTSVNAPYLQRRVKRVTQAAVLLSTEKGCFPQKGAIRY